MGPFGLVQPTPTVFIPGLDRIFSGLRSLSAQRATTLLRNAIGVTP